MPDHSNANRTMIEAVGLSKFYGEFAATREVTFSVPLGQVCAFLGPNGAGKSTTMKMLTGYLAPSDGEARIGGFDLSTDRNPVTTSVVFQRISCCIMPEFSSSNITGRAITGIRGLDFQEQSIEISSYEASSIV